MQPVQPVAFTPGPARVPGMVASRSSILAAATPMRKRWPAEYAPTVKNSEGQPVLVAKAPAASTRKIEVLVEVCSEPKLEEKADASSKQQPEVKSQGSSVREPEAESQGSLEQKPEVRSQASSVQTLEVKSESDSDRLGTTSESTATHKLVAKSLSKPARATANARSQNELTAECKFQMRLRDELMSFNSRSLDVLTKLETNERMQRTMYQRARETMTYYQELANHVTVVRPSSSGGDSGNSRPTSTASQAPTQAVAAVPAVTAAPVLTTAVATKGGRASLDMEAGTVKRRIKEYERAASVTRPREAPTSTSNLTKSASWSAFPREGVDPGWVNSKPLPSESALVNTESQQPVRSRAPEPSAHHKDDRSLSVRERILALQARGLML